jgi:hypothetical protein
MSISRADRLTNALTILEKTHGKDARLKSDRPLDQLMALVLTTWVTGDRAVKAVKILMQEFVD